MDNYLTKLSKIEILLTNIGHGQNFDKHWTETGQNLDICQKIVQILSNPPFYRSTHSSGVTLKNLLKCKESNGKSVARAESTGTVASFLRPTPIILGLYFVSVLINIAV